MLKRFGTGWRRRSRHSAAATLAAFALALTTAVTGPGLTGTASAAVVRPDGGTGMAASGTGPKAPLSSPKPSATTAPTEGAGAARKTTAREIASAGADLPEACSGAITLGTTYLCATRPPGGSRFTFDLPKATDLVFLQLVGLNHQDPYQRLTAPDGSAVACTRPPGNGYGAWRCPTHTAGTYTLDVSGDEDSSAGYSVEAYALLSDPACTQITDEDVSLGAPNSFSGALSGGSAGHCYALPLAAGDVLRTHVSKSQVNLSVNDATGKEVCTTYPGSGGEQIECRLTGEAPYRLLAYQISGESVDAYSITADRLSDPVGCPVVTPQAYGTVPDTSSFTRCRILRVPATGPYLYGPVHTGTSVNGDLRKADGTSVCTPTLLAPCTLTAGDYTWARTLRDENPDAFGMWFHATDSGEGCTAVRDDGFASGPVTGTFSALGQRLCLTLPTAAGQGAHLFSAPPADSTHPDVEVFDAKGVQQCRAEYSHAVCKLTGTAPFRAVVSGLGQGNGYRLVIQRTSETGGCLPWSQTSWGPSSGTKAQLTADRPATCLAIGADAHSVAEMFDYSNTANRNTAYIEVYDRAGEKVCGTSYSLTTTTCAFKAGTAYAAVLFGAADTYRLVRRDVSATAKCAAPKSTAVGGPSVGYTFTTSLDSTCLHVSGAAGDKFWFSARTSTTDDSGAMLGVVDSAGRIVCWQWGVACRPTGSAGYVVFALASGYAGKAIPARLDTWRVGTSAGWAPECTAHKVSAEGFSARSGVLSESGTAYCAQVSMKPRQEFKVYGAASGYSRDVPWVSVLGNDGFGNNAPYGCYGENMGEFRYHCSAGSSTSGGQVVIVSPDRSAMPVEYTIQGVCHSGCAVPRQRADASSLSLSSGAAGTSHLVVLRGKKLTLGTEVELSSGSWQGSYRMATPVSVNSDGTELTVRLSTRSTPPGRYDLVLDNTGYTSGERSPGYLPNAFTVTAAPAVTRGRFVPVTPKRILDTRTGTGAPKARLGAGGTVKLKVAGAGGVPATGATAVVVNLTAVAPTADGRITAWADGATRPDTTALSTTAGQTTTTTVVVPVRNGAVNLRNSTGYLDLFAEVTGYYTTSTTAGSKLTTVTPKRILDTRVGTGAPKARVGAGATVKLKVAGVGGVPATGATAVVVNLTVVKPTTNGHITAWADGTTRPSTTHLTFTGGRTSSNSVTVPVRNGVIDLRNSAGSVDLVADVSGYYSADGSRYTPAAPVRLLNTSTGLGARPGAVGPDQTVSFPVRGMAGVPDDAKAVTLAVTVGSPTTTSYVTVAPHGRTWPGLAALTYGTGRAATNLITVPVTDGWVSLTNHSGSVQLRADLMGWFTG